MSMEDASILLLALEKLGLVPPGTFAFGADVGPLVPTGEPFVAATAPASWQLHHSYGFFGGFSGFFH